MKGKMKRLLSKLLAISMIVTSISFSPSVVKADTTATATKNAAVTIQNDTKTAFGDKDGDLYNYVKYGADATADGANSNKPVSGIIDGSVAGDANRWANESNQNGHWVQVDLRHSYSISQISISWEVASSLNYKLEISNDGKKYEEVTNVTINGYDTANPKNRVDKIVLSNSVMARYIKITDVGSIFIPKSDNASERRYGVSIWEVGIFGNNTKASQERAFENTSNFTKQDNNSGVTFDDILDNQFYNYVRNNGVSASASGVDSNTPINDAIDNNSSTRWSHGGGDATYYTVDLGAVYRVEKVYLSWEQANATIYNIYKSEDGNNYSLITTVNGMALYNTGASNGARVDKIDFNSVNARYIKIQAVQRCYKGSDYSGGQFSGMSLFEVGIYGKEQEKAYSKKAFPEYKVGNKDTIGNVIEAEDTDSRESGISIETNGPVSGKNLGGLSSGKWTQYNINFDRKTSKVYFRYAGSGSAGNIQIYIDDSSMSGTPVATVHVGSTGGWTDYQDISADVEIPAGNHKVYLKFVPDAGTAHVCNLDYFQFEYKPETASVKHEAENAHAYVRGTAGSVPNKNQQSDKFSQGKAVGAMNTWIEHDRSYLTTYVKADYAGYYNLTIQYSGTMTTLLQYKINNAANWSTQNINDVDSNNWDGVKSTTVQVQLKQGINKIDISGAVWKWADGTSTGRTDGKNVWDEWLNIDCFTLEYKDNVKNAYTEELNTTLVGNRIEAEAFDGRDAKGEDGVKAYDNTYLGHTTKDSFALYNVYFDRDTTKLNFHASAKSDSCDGYVEVWVDDNNRSGKPVAKVSLQDIVASDWGSYRDVTVTLDTPIEYGNHEIMLYFVPKDKSYVGNIDYFTFEYTPEEVKDKGDRHEAENAHAYTQGDADSEHTIQSDGKFSNGKAVGGMNAWPDNGRAYLTSYVNVKHPGRYKLVVAYASGSAKDTNIDFRINSRNDTDWKSIAAPTTNGWTTVKTISREIELNRGINVIDITGAANIPYAENDAWQQVNVDYFALERITDADNLAFGKPVEASGSQNGYDAANAVDEDEDTRWASNLAGDAGYFIVDLQGFYEIEKVNLVFEKAYPDEFQILVSRDKKNWTVAKTERGFKKTPEADYEKYESTAGVCLGKARYVKIRCLKMAYHDKMSIREFKVYGTKLKGELSDLALSKEVSVSTSEATGNTSNPNNAIDGKDDTRWAAPNRDSNPWYQIDLGKQCSIDSIDLKFERAYPKSFRIQISDNGKDWKDYRTVTNWTEPGNATEIQKDNYYANLEFGISFHMDNVKTRYVRLYTDAKIRDNSWGLSIYEFEIWGKELDKKDYWKAQSAEKYGIYPVSGLQDTEKNEMIDSSLVQDDVIGHGDTFEVVYEPDKELFFYINPWEFEIDYSKHQICWSSQNQGESLWGATEHDENVTRYGAQQQATVKYVLPKNIDFGDKDYVISEIGCQIYEKTDLGTEGAKPKRTIVFKVKVLKSNIIIEDNLKNNGSLNIKNPEDGCTYEWQRSSDGKNWTNVSPKRYDLEILSSSKNGVVNDIVHVAEDLGGGQYYRVRKAGDENWSQPHKVKYYNDVQNGDFEYPSMFSTDEDGRLFPFNANGDEQQYPNGYEGLMWKTTAPGWTNGVNANRIGHDIEIVNGRKLKTNEKDGQVSQFSVTPEEMYKNNEHGDQFAELNCENVGALYQDILTTPNSQCYWDLDYAGRWCQNSMYVVAMSSKEAQNYTTAEQIKELISKQEVQNIVTNQEGSKGTTVELSQGVFATIWKVTSKENAGEWNDHNGVYNVPSGDKNYLTRFFFVSAGGARRNEGDTPNETVGSLLDNVTFAQRQAYTIEYYIDGVKQDNLTVTSLENPYDRVDIPNPSQVQNYTLSQALISGENDANSKNFYVDDSDRKMTIAYNHNVLKLYYKSGVVVTTVKIVGLSEIPNDYSVLVYLKDENGKVIDTVTMPHDSFTKIDKVNVEDEDSFFKTVTFDGNGLTNGQKYTVEEVVVKNDYLPYYLNNVDKNGVNENVGIDKIGKENLSYTADFIYNSSAGNNIEFVNVYKPVRKITIQKNVLGNMAETDKSFDFTLSIEKDGSPIDATDISTTIFKKTATGKYAFSLKDKESVELFVYNGCKVTVSEADYSKKTGIDTNIYSDDYYVTSWKVDEGDNLDGRTVTVNEVDRDIKLVCNNEYNDLGDVEVQGFQMNGNKEIGGVSEFSPSFRVVCRVSRKTIKTKKVKKFGVIYAIKGEAADSNRETLEKIMTFDGADKNENVKVHEETPDGVYQEWTTKDGTEFSAEHWKYYGLTFKCLNYMFDTLEENVTVRAYAEMADGTIEYGQKIYTVNMYEIAENLYKNQKMSTSKGHQFLYDNVLNLVTMHYNRQSIAKAMMKVLNVTSTSSQYYDVLNKVYKDMNDFVYCQKAYKGKYQEREAFVPISLSEQELSDLVNVLNQKRGTKYTNLNDWIYYETEKVGAYKGYYRKVQYEWNNGIYIRK